MLILSRKLLKLSKLRDPFKKNSKTFFFVYPNASILFTESLDLFSSSFLKWKLNYALVQSLSFIRLTEMIDVPEIIRTDDENDFPNMTRNFIFAALSITETTRYDTIKSKISQQIPSSFHDIHMPFFSIRKFLLYIKVTAIK